jgi:SAM-dependent methyltransferase
MIKAPSKGHKNKGLHNWAVYQSLDKILLKNTAMIRGCVYDLGCADTHYKTFLLKYAEEYKGVDWANSYHDTQADIIANLNSELPLENNVADTVFTISTLEHLAEPQLFLDEANRILKPDGALLLQVPWQWQIHEAPHDYYRFTPFGLKYLLEKAHFKDIQITPQLGLFSTLFLKLNYFLNRFSRGPKWLRFSINIILLPIWTTNQLLGKVLDILDTNWSQETCGYVVVARKGVQSNDA